MEQWAQKRPKVKGIHTDFKPICEDLKKTAQVYDRNIVSMSLLVASGGAKKYIWTNLIHPYGILLVIVNKNLKLIQLNQQMFTNPNNMMGITARTHSSFIMDKLFLR